MSSYPRQFSAIATCNKQQHFKLGNQSSEKRSYHYMSQHPPPVIADQYVAHQCCGPKEWHDQCKEESYLPTRSAHMRGSTSAMNRGPTVICAAIEAAKGAAGMPSCSSGVQAALLKRRLSAYIALRTAQLLSNAITTTLQQEDVHRCLLQVAKAPWCSHLHAVIVRMLQVAAVPPLNQLAHAPAFG